MPAAARVWRHGRTGISSAYRRFALLGSGLLLGLLTIALGRWALGLAPPVNVTPLTLAHMALIIPALPLGLAIILAPKGTRRHRALGRLWAGSMWAGALVSLGLVGINGGISPIHPLSVAVLAMIPLGVHRARTGRIDAHAGGFQIMYAGALIVAGLFTFAPGRILYTLAFG